MVYENDDGNNNLFKQQIKGFETKAIHAGQNSGGWKSKCVVPPIITSVTFQQTDINEYDFEYGRCGNPTKTVLETCIASIDNAKFCLTFSAGLGALSNIGQLLKPGDHIIASNKIFGGTIKYFTEISRKQEIEVDFISVEDYNTLKKTIKKNTKMIWIETPTNPTLTIIDIKAIADIAHVYPNVLLVVDNTFLSSYFQRPLELGADIVMYSLSKYMNGHTDVIMGAITTNNKSLYEKLQSLQIVLGNIPSPFDCYQVNRGLKTLALRMKQHSKNSLTIAKFLESHNAVEKVFHPGLQSHPQHKLAITQSYGHSGMIAMYVKGDLHEAQKFLKSIKLVMLATSLGSVESVAQFPYLMTHGCVAEDEKLKLGITKNLVRLSIGLEDADDLIEDLNQALICSQN